MRKPLLLILLLPSLLFGYTGNEVTAIISENLETKSGFQVYQYRYYNNGVFIQFRGDHQGIGYQFQDINNIVEISIESNNTVTGTLIHRF